MKMLRFLLIVFVLNVSVCMLNGQKQQITINCCNNVTCTTTDDQLPLIYSPSLHTTVSEKPPFLSIKTIDDLSCGPTNRLKSVSYNGGIPNFFISDTGLLLLIDTNKRIAANKFCFVNKTLAKYCTKEEFNNKTTVKKCCGKGAVFSEIKQSCVKMNVTDYKINIGNEKRLIQGFPNCEFSRHVIAGKLHNHEELLANGSIILPESGVLLAEGEFCLEHVLEDAVAPSILTCNHHIPTTTSRPLPEPDIRLKIYPFALLLSAIFLAATLVAGAALPAVHHHALHWRCQTNHVACLLVGDVLLASTQLAGTNVNSIICVAIAFSMHFFFLAAFFWLNTMCFNIWWTFRDLRPGTLEKRQERCRLRIYGVYAWGLPFIISMIALTLHTIPDGPEYTFLRPRFGEKKCWFPGNMEIFTYFYGPIGILLIINLLLFAATARELTCGLWKRELVKSTTERAALGRVCMKLVIVMGVTWIADILSWAVGGPEYLWYITDLINALQGLFIFIVVACQPQVWSALKRLWCKRQSLTADITGNGNHHSSSSHGYGLPSESVTNHSVSNTNTNTNTTRSTPIETNC